MLGGADVQEQNLSVHGNIKLKRGSVGSAESVQGTWVNSNDGYFSFFNKPGPVTPVIADDANASVSISGGINFLQ